MGEKILAVKAELITSMKIPEGISLHSEREMKSYLSLLQEGLVVEDRSLLEGNPEYRQLIPYIVLEYDSGRCPTYFTAIRTPKSGDPRLHGKRIIGFGGHANWIDVPSSLLTTQLKLNAHRELEEELVIESSFDFFFDGFINVMTTPVDKDHIGIYINVVLKNPRVQIKETSILINGEFLSKDSIRQYYTDLENWSMVVLNILK